MDSNQVALDNLAEKIKQCTACPLYKDTTQAVPGEGNPNAEIVLIGEGPGYYEDKSGRPFVGRAGQLLEATLAKVGLGRDEVFIANVVKHRPPDNRDPDSSEIVACEHWLDQQLLIIRPKIIVTLGRFSMAKFMPSAKISTIHGEPRRVRSYIVLPMYHPAAALRGSGLMQAFQGDFLKNKELLQNPGQSLAIDEKGEEDTDQIKLF